MTKSETEVLANESEILTLSNGLEVAVNRIKTRETFKLLKILTRGASYALQTVEFGENSEDFAQSLIMALIFAIPEAEDETIEFVQTIVSPVGLESGKSKAVKEANDEVYNKFVEALDNPELDDLVEILTKVIEVEAPHIQELGKKIALLLKNYRPVKS